MCYSSMQGSKDNGRPRLHAIDGDSTAGLVGYGKDREPAGEIAVGSDSNGNQSHSVTQAIVGILLCIYGLFLIVAGLYDKSNPFKVMTFGKWQYVDDDIGNRRQRVLR